MTSSEYFIGVDVGGTFTDVTVYDRTTGRAFAVKSPSNRAAPDRAVLAAIDKAGVPASSVRRIVHGTTVATNALLERRGGPAAFVANDGFRDVIELGRTTRLTPGSLYDPYFRRPEPVIRRRDRHEIAARMLHDGTELTALDEPGLDRLGAELKAQGITSVAVGFVNAFRNPAQERRAREILSRHVEFVTISTDVLNEVREYERFFAAALNAYLIPVMSRYVGTLRGALGKSHPQASFFTVASNGGLLSTPAVREAPVRTILSGPAAGLAATRQLAEALGLPQVITCDMGGTSTDVALVADCTLPVKRETILEGDVIRVPQLDIHTVGAGGGSVAALDAGGALMVGPESAGARPGPAAYGHGGTRPTVTDANVVLGRLGGEQELGASLHIDRDAAIGAMRSVSDPAGLAPEALAEGVIDLAVAKMSAAVHEISVARGYDPADCALLAFGGAGPLHACLVAEDLGIPKVIAPPDPGAFSAFGALCSALTKDASETLLLPADVDALDRMERFATAKAADMERDFRDEGIDPEGFWIERRADLRYDGQAHELTVSYPEGVTPETLREIFETAFEREYGRRDSDRALVVVNARVVGRVPVRAPVWARPGGGSGEPYAKRDIYLRGEIVSCAVWNRHDLPRDSAVRGPAVIEEMSSTTWLPMGWTARCGTLGEIEMLRDAPQ